MRSSIVAITVVLLISSLCYSQTDTNNLGVNYGFGDIEIIKLDWGIKELCLGDFNRDGRNDIAIANNRKAKIELLLQQETIGPVEQPIAVDEEDVDVNLLNGQSRFKKDSVAISQKVASLVCGDLNSDGLLDLAFYGEPQGLYVILQKEAIKASETLNWRTRKKIKIEDGLLSQNALVCDDLNNDGKDDLVLSGRDTIYIILQKEDGSLAEAVKYPISERPLGVKVGDLNGDKINDLLILTNNKEKPVFVRFGLEAGKLGPQFQFFSEMPYNWELANIDDTPGNELLTVDSRSGRLICYKLLLENKSDSEWPILFYPLESGQGQANRDLVVGDVDGDGLADVTISDPGAAELILYKQSKGIGLSEPVRFPALSDITSLSIADIDGDSKAEIAVLSVKEKALGISKFENDRLSFPKPLDLIDEPVASVLSDIDQDKKIDCVYISKDVNDVRTLRIIYSLDKSGKKGLFGHKTSDTALVLEKLDSNPAGIKAVDVDQDGLKDVLIFVQYDKPILVRQVKKGTFEVVIAKGTQESLIKEANLLSTFVADIDGKKGKELLISQKNFARSLVFSQGESWSIIDQYNAKSTENNIATVAAFGLDTKEAPAILLLDGQKGQLQILKAGDDKTYRFDKEIEVGKWASAGHLKMLYAPLTGGEGKSILLFDSSKFALVTTPAKSSHAYTLEQKFSYETKIKDGLYGDVTSGDINDDGKPDIVMVEYKNNHIEILALDKENKPTPAMRFKIYEEKGYRDDKRGKISVEPREMAIADVNNDGKADLVTVIHDRIIIYPQD